MLFNLAIFLPVLSKVAQNLGLFSLTYTSNPVVSDIKIDDKIENLVNGDIKILFTAYHNKNISDEELKNQGIIRAKDWLDIKKILLESGEE